MTRLSWKQSETGRVNEHCALCVVLLQSISHVTRASDMAKAKKPEGEAAAAAGAQGNNTVMQLYSPSPGAGLRGVGAAAPPPSLSPP